MSTPKSERGVKGRGFASMSPERLKEITKRGGKATQAKGVGHRWTAESGRAAAVEGKAKAKARRLVAEQEKP